VYEKPETFDPSVFEDGEMTHPGSPGKGIRKGKKFPCIIQSEDQKHTSCAFGKGSSEFEDMVTHPREARGRKTSPEFEFRRKAHIRVCKLFADIRCQFMLLA
jgi:hypothetical protein